MKTYKKVLVVFISIIFFIPLFVQNQQAQEEKPIKIPPEVAKVIDENLLTRQARLDIPLTFVKTLYFPYQADFFSCFFLKVKNSDLGYLAPVLEEKKTEEVEKVGEKPPVVKKRQEEEAKEEEQILTCNADFFFRVYSLGKNGEVKGVFKEIYLPFADQVGSKGYNPEEENLYSFGTIFPPGRYLLAAASASLDLTKIGLVFQEFYLPRPSDFKRNLSFTPPFFVKSIKRMPSPDTVIILYKNLFHYSVLEIEPYFDHEFGANEKLDIFYIILGVTPAEDGKFTFEVRYTYKKGEEEVVKFEPKVQSIPAPIISLPLPLTFSDKKLEPGEYTLEINVKDKIGRKEGTEKVNFLLK